MAHKYGDLVAQYTETTGTGTYTLTTAVANRRTFGAVLSNGDTTDYQVMGVDNAGNPAWEVGTGTYATSGTTLARTTIRSSSTGSAINWGTGIKTVTMVQAAGSMVTTTPSGHIKATGITPANGALPIGNGTDFTVATLTGTTNRITATNSAGGIVLSTPQDTHTAASPNFAGLKVGSRTSATASETIVVSPGAGVAGASVKVGIANSGTGDGSPNVAYIGIDGSALSGVAFLDTGAFGVAGAAPYEFRTSGTARWRVDSTAFRPSADNTYSLGTSSFRASVIYAATGTINTSDAREKKDVSDCPLGLGFINSLRPVSYRWKVGGHDLVRELVGYEPFEVSPTVIEQHPVYRDTPVPRPGQRTHLGLIAQEVRDALRSAGVDAALWTQDDPADPESRQGLRYDQLIAPLILAVQELSARVEALEGRST